MSDLLFARFAPKTLEPKSSIGAKWGRLLEQLDLPTTVKDRRVAIKMHLGGGNGFSTIHHADGHHGLLRLLGHDHAAPGA